MAAPLRPLPRAYAAFIRQLSRERRVRASEAAFVVEGIRACGDLIRSYPNQIRSVVVSSAYLRQEATAGRADRALLDVVQYSCSDEIFTKLSDVEAPQGLLVVVHMPTWTEADGLGCPQLLGVYGERLQDPANVGTIIRTAAGLGLSGVWLSKDSIDCYHPKVVRGTAGAILAMPVFQGVTLSNLSEAGCSIYAAVVSGDDAVELTAVRNRAARSIIAVGNESQGLDPVTVSAATCRFSIPLTNRVESLNVAASVAIAAYHFAGLPLAKSSNT